MLGSPGGTGCDEVCFPVHDGKISAIPTTMNPKTNFITANSTGTAKIENVAYGTEKLLKAQVSEDFV